MPGTARLVTITLATGLLLSAGGCATHHGAGGGSVKQLSFATPEDAVSALLYLSANNDRAYGQEVFGPEVDELSSGDPEVDAHERELLAQAIQRRHDLRRNGDGTIDILIGKDGVEFPVPLTPVNGRWMFDTPEGVERMTDIRVGYYELKAIASMRALVVAQSEYRSVDRDGDGVLEYATKFVSTSGRQDGLFWVTAPNEPNSPLGGYLADAGAPRSDDLGYQGYFFKMLTAQGPGAPGGAKTFLDAAGNLVGGWAVLAYPAVYGETAVMSFLVSGDGVVFEKDLGAAATKRAGQTITVFDPAGWSKVTD